MAGPLLYGKYQLVELIARGGMAEVYKAKSHGVEGFEKLVVIKRILPEYSRDAAFVEMFINEAKIAVTLNHANIVQVFDLGRSDDSYFIAMEFVQGLDLAQVIARARALSMPVPVELAVHVVSEAAKGLDYAHRRKDQDLNPLGIVHRDISPQNILVSYEGETKITDFGVAWALGAVGAEETVKGKARYMAPEQARGEEVDRRADIYSLGVVLYEILLGQNPLRDSSDTTETLERLQVGGHQPLALAAPDLPTELCGIVDRAMAVDPEGRQSDAGRVYEELISFLFTTGRRVGVHDLALFLEQLREAEPAEGAVDDSGKNLRDAFSDQVRTSRQPHRPEATPVEVPSSSPPTHDDGTGARRLATELWDVTAVAWEVLGDAPPQGVVAELTDLIEREGGRVVEAYDDHSVALFGLQARDGRDTESGLSGALKTMRLAQTLRDKGAEGFVIGVGVHAGKVVMVPSGTLPKRDRRYESLMERARMLATRGAGAVTVSQETQRASQDLFQFRPVGTGEWLVEGQRPRGETYGRFVGRRDELRRIGEQLAFSNRGAGSVLFLIGEPGTGKTRLLHETRKRLTAGGHSFNWYQVRCAPHLSQIPFSGLALMIRELLGVEVTDPEERVREQVERLRELGLAAEEVEAVASLLGVPGEDDARSSQVDREIRVALLHIGTKLAQDRLTVLVWDAAEKIDAHTIESLAALSHGSTWARVMVLLACRPPLDSAWKVIGNPHQLELGPLPDPDTRKLASSWLGVADLPEALANEIAHKSGGNPLYVEEYVKAQLASGAVTTGQGRVAYRPENAEIEVPKSLRGLLEARIERLDGSLRGFLQRAAVLAPRFSGELLAAVAGTTLPDTQNATEKLWREGILEKTGREEYIFANDMLRDVVYDGITFSDRKEIHRIVAAHLEQHHADRLEDVYDRLAHHHRESGAHDRAVEFLCAAAEKYSFENAHQAAYTHYIRALELLQNLPGSEHQRVLDIYRRAGESAVSAGLADRAVEKMRLGVELAEAVGDQAAAVMLLTLVGRLFERAKRFGEAHSYLSQALQLCDDLGDEHIRRVVLGSIGEAHSHNGEYRQATEFLEEALDLVQTAGDKRRETDLQRELGLCWAARGQLERSKECIARAADAAAAVGDRLLQCEVLKSRGLACYMVRDDAGALDAFSRALEMAKEYGFAYEIAANSHNMGDIQIRTGDHRAAFTMLRFSHEVARQHGLTKLETLNMMLLGYIDAFNFGSGEGVVRIERALRFAQDHNYTWDAIQATYFLGKAYVKLGDEPRARAALNEAIRLGRATDSRLYVEECQQLLESLGLKG